MKRNSGIDALRMCSMFMVVVLHVLAQGSILSSVGASPYSVNYQLAWFFETAACCAVNCFALISGYVGVNAKFRYYKGIVLWLQIVFWTLVITIVFAVVRPDVVSVRQLINAVLPVSMQQYWYVTAYFCVFPFIPFMNKLLQNLKQRELKILGITIAVCVSLLPTLVLHDLYTLQGGYAATWIAMLYLLGGVLQKTEFGKGMKKLPLFFIYLAAVVAAWGAKFVFEVHPVSIISSNFLISYTAPTMLVCAVALLLLFSKLECRADWVKKLIAVASPLAFSVYIIHSNPLIWNYWLSGRYADAADKSPFVLLLTIFGAALAIYVVCSLADAVRSLVFHVGKIAERGRKLELRWRKEEL